MSVAATPLSIETRRSSVDRSARHDVDKAAVELASIMTTASNPVSPGASSPPLPQDHPSAAMQHFSPPARPSSTPFPEPEHGQTDIRCLSCPTADLILESSHHVSSHVRHQLPPPVDSLQTTPSPLLSTSLDDLPAEIRECILDHLFGYRVSATSKSSLGMPSVTRSWGTALRHSRRRELSSLALVNSDWRVLVQERLYRHIKIKATVQSLNDATQYFVKHPHLRPYVRHVELWFAVFQARHIPLAHSGIPTVTLDGFTNASYVIPNDNCSLEEAFYFVSSTFPEICVLTLEGGERKKAPKVRHYILETGHEKPLARIPSVQTLVCKGQWNLVRSNDDFQAIVGALPNLQEWHGSYSKAKSKSYLSMATILPRLPSALSSLSLNLEGVEYRRELSFPPYFLKVSNSLHFCTKLAEAASELEHFAYTGRVCRGFFELLSRQVDSRSTRLKTIDLTVKNCCRHVIHWNESGSGITDMNFISAFEALVLAGIKALAKLKAVEYLRVRYVDLGMYYCLSFRTHFDLLLFTCLHSCGRLDSPVPPLNPYFVLHDGWCSGVWSDAIVDALHKARPDARFEELAESFGEVAINKDGRLVISPDYPKNRVLSLKLSNYAYLAGGVAVP